MKTFNQFITELSKKTLKRYIKASEKDERDAFKKDDYSRGMKRAEGQFMAADALARKKRK